jgi:hypothetical protein
MRFLVLTLALLLAATATAQEKAAKKKPVVAKKQAVHKKPTPEQIRKFKQLQKQREAKG